MGMLLVLVGDRGAVAVGADSARRLAKLGVTRVAVLKDEEGLALALEGWAFESSRLSDSVLEIVAPSAGRSRTLHQIAEVAVTDGGPDDPGPQPFANDPEKGGSS